jgi:hypothetical protein
MKQVKDTAKGSLLFTTLHSIQAKKPLWHRVWNFDFIASVFAHAFSFASSYTLVSIIHKKDTSQEGHLTAP